MKIILASASPRRRELLAQIIPEFDVIPSDGEESVTGEDPSGIVTELARRKAESVARRLAHFPEKKDFGADAGGESPAEESREGMLVIGADTIVVQNGRILGKPADGEDAFRMLRALSDSTHRVYTGVCLLSPGSAHNAGLVQTFYEMTEVTFYPMTDEEIRAYIRTGDPMDKAGAYGIQSGCAKYVRGISGDYNNVVGLPLARLYHELKRQD